MLLGEVAGHRSPARVHTPIMGARDHVRAGASTTLPLEPAFEHGALVVEGAVTSTASRWQPGALLYLGSDRRELALSRLHGGRVMILGGEPFAEEIIMWWNFVARTHDEIVQARNDWMSAARFDPHGGPAPDDRYGEVVGFDGGPLPAPDLPNLRLRPRRDHDRRGHRGLTRWPAVVRPGQRS